MNPSFVGVREIAAAQPSVGGSTFRGCRVSLVVLALLSGACTQARRDVGRAIRIRSPDRRCEPPIGGMGLPTEPSRLRISSLAS